MKISSEDPILTAYALGELDASSCAAVEAAFTEDDSLAGEGAALKSLVNFMEEVLEGEALSLGDVRREEVLRSGRLPDAESLVLDHRRKSRRQSFFAIVGVAAAVVIGFVWLSRLGVDELKRSQPVVGEAASAGGGDLGGICQLGYGAVTGLEGFGDHSFVLPTYVQQVDLSSLEKSLVEMGELPERDFFKIAPWVNAGTLSSEPHLVVAKLGVSAELGDCLWDEKKTLLFVSLRSLDGKRALVKGVLNFNPERVRSSTFLGAVEGQESTVAQSRMMEGDLIFLYELDLLPGGEALGVVDLVVEGHFDVSLPLSEEFLGVKTPSDDFLMARVFAEFAKWGRSEKREVSELSSITERVRELLGRVTDEKTRYALDMILLSEEVLSR